ncbi:interferon regulatory factor 2 isoform X1 [Xiphophorus maculatus]|uniref:interferon regulatory factor 2 isoform X1 n=2 Tax=Xiphophorus maculatus TaxID=8083 RepID=UPI0003B76241|nr:interferon regulatory factor 2 isoform X1 [Xiphophorus maculatus]
MCILKPRSCYVVHLEPSVLFSDSGAEEPQAVQTETVTMPVERMRMRPWLEEQINSCQIPGLKWVNKEKRIFQIPWMHAARHGWDLEKDAPLFMRWAIHTGKYQPGVDRPDPKTWKANFRCAMNSLPDIEEVKDKSIKKGTNAFRVYKMLSSTERSLKKGKKKADKEGKSKGSKEGAAQSPNTTFSEVQPGPVDCSKQLALKVEARELTVTNSGSALHSPAGDHLIQCEQLPDVCQTIEVTTENEEQTVSSSHSYPLQISPVSSCCGSDTESDTEDNKEALGPTWKREYPSVLRIPPCSLPGMASFVNPSKPNFRVTSLKDPTPLISYHIDSWTPACGQNSHTPPSSSHAHEVRASVIRKTSDVTSS